eukprot:5641817-Alexandrium_andersonii.AAC.1
MQRWPSWGRGLGKRVVATTAHAASKCRSAAGHSRREKAEVHNNSPATILMRVQKWCASMERIRGWSMTSKRHELRRPAD